MKKKTILVLITVLGVLIAQAQVSFGVKAGVNFASISGDSEDIDDGRTGFYFGGLAEIPITDRLSFQPELLYSAQGAAGKSSESFDGQTVDFDTEINLEYLNIPLMAKYYLTEAFSFEFGPQFGFLLSAEGISDITTSIPIDGIDDFTEEEDLKDVFTSMDFGLNFGAEYKLGIGLFVNARYCLGLTNFNDADDEEGQKLRNSVLQLGIGYKF